MTPLGRLMPGMALIDLLPGEIIVGAVLEGHDHVRQAVKRDRTQRRHARRAVDAAFHRHGDQPLHFLGGMARPLGDQFHHGRRKIGIGVHRKPVERADAQAQKQGGHQEDQQRLVQRGGHQPVHDRTRRRRQGFRRGRRVAGSLIAAA